MPILADASDPEVIETMTQDGLPNGPEPRDGADGDARRALYALLAGAEGCGPAARSARLAQDDELAESLLRVQGEIAGEAARPLKERMAE